MDLQGKTVLIVGAGKSGIAAGELLRKKGIAYRLYDGNKELSKEELQKNDIWKDCGIILGELPTEILADTGLAVLSPGVPTDLPVIAAIREQGIPIWGEIELAYHFAKGRLLAITGTNGKTTTTSLLGEIMQAYFEDVKVVGNIGIPYTSVAADTTDETVTVAEISSFQLETAVDFHPQVSAILNITPDHLNRHHTMECYIETKESITKNQQKEDVCVLNYEDEVLLEFGKSIPIAIPPLSKIACFISSFINILGLVSFFNKCFETIPIIGFLFNFILLPHCIIFSYCIFHRIFNTIYYIKIITYIITHFIPLLFARLFSFLIK